MMDLALPLARSPVFYSHVMSMVVMWSIKEFLFLNSTNANHEKLEMIFLSVIKSHI